MREHVRIGRWSSTGVDQYGVEWKTKALSGFHEPTTSNGAFTKRPQGDGAFDSRVTESGRALGVTLQVSAPDRHSRDRAERQLSALAWRLREPTVIEWHGDFGVKTATVRRFGQSQFDYLNDRAFRAQLQWFAPDPFWYGESRSSRVGLPVDGGGLTWPLFSPDDYLDFGTPGVAGQVILLNQGTADAWPRFRVDGPIIGGTVIIDTTSNRALEFAGDVGAGSVLDIDSRTGRVTLDGVSFATDMRLRQWFSIPPDGHKLIQFATNGSYAQDGMLTAAVTDTYI